MKKLDGWHIPLATIIGVALVAGYLHCPPKSEVLAAWVQAVGSILAILAAVWVARRQAEQTRQLEIDRAAADAEKDHAETQAFVQSVLNELGAIWSGYNANIRPHLYEVGEGDFFNGIVPVGSDLFTIYNNASPRVGKVNDEELRALIVLTYARAKGFVYSLQMNNNMVADIDNFSIMYKGEKRDEMIAHKHAVLARYATLLKEHDGELERLLGALHLRATDWLTRGPVTRADV